jgi:hypothetical protein
MNNRHQLDRLVKLLMSGKGDNTLLSKLVRNYRLFDLTGHSYMGLTIFILRSYGDLVEALNQIENDDADIPHMHVK